MMFSLPTVAMIAGFGLLGILSRYAIDQWTESISPAGTWAINIFGSALAGLVFVLGEKQSLSQALQVGLLVGFCGGFTTFSTYALQSFLLLEKGKLVTSVLYFTLSPLAGLMAAAGSVLLARKFI